MNQSALISRGSNAKRNPHAIIGTHQNAYTTNQKVVANGETRLYSSTQAKLVKKMHAQGTIAMTSNERKEI